MIYYLRSTSTDATYNLALEQYLFDELDRAHSYIMLWQNENAVVIGKHQNALEEIDAAFVKAHGIQVVRRLSGGGAVYHDLGNINFTFIADVETERFDFATFCRPIAHTLRSLGADVEIGGRNDMSIKGMKFSGNSQYIKNNRVMHHGTILFQSNLEIVAGALNAPKDKYQSKGFPSARSRVTNACEHTNRPCAIEEFIGLLEADLIRQFSAVPLPPEAIRPHEVEHLQAAVYRAWEWNYGYFPAYRSQTKRRIEGVGEISVHSNVADGRIKDIAFSGDYFALREQSELAKALCGVPLEEKALAEALGNIDISHYISGLSKADFIAMLV